MISKVAILCGGRGTRIVRGEEDLPKPLVAVGGKPMLWQVMSLYANQGFSDFVLLTGWQSDRVTSAVNAFDEVQSGDWSVEFVETGDDTPTGGRVARAADQLSGATFALTYADGVADIDLAALANFHSDHDGLATITVARPSSPWGEAQIGEDDRVTGFVEKPQLDNWINAGFMVLEPEALDYIGVDDILERGPLDKLARAGELRAFKHEGFWDCMDTIKDAQVLNELCADGTPPWLTPQVAGVKGRAS